MSRYRPDPLARKIVRDDPAHPPLTVAFSGILGESHTTGFVRLYLDEELRDWFDVAKDDIRYSERYGEGLKRRTVLWVDQRSTLERRQAQPTDIHGDYLTGDIDAVGVSQTAMCVALELSVAKRTPAKSPYCYARRRGIIGRAGLGPT